MNTQILKNGLKLITVPMSGTKTATILVMVGTGSKYEKQSNNGISHFLEHMFFKGTKKRPTALALASELDSLGAEYNAFTSKEYTGYWVKVQAEKIKEAVEIVSDMLSGSKMDSKEMKREKGVIIEEINMYQDNPMSYMEEVFESCLYGNTPAGWETLGPKKNILKFSRKDFIDYLESQYGTHNITVSLVGNIGSDYKKHKATIEKYFSSVALNKRGKKFQEKETVVEKQSKPQLKIHYKKTDQVHISLGARAFGYDHKDKDIAKLISIILGGSMSSRLFINLRERQGLAYYVHTDAEFYTDSGYITTASGVPVNRVDQAIEIILKEYKKIKNVLVDEKELKRAKDLLRGRLTIQLEESDNVANWYGRQIILQDAIERKKEAAKRKDVLKEITTPEAYMKRIEKINVNDIKRVANDIFQSSKLNLALIGPFKDKSKFEKLMKM